MRGCARLCSQLFFRFQGRTIFVRDSGKFEVFKMGILKRMFKMFRKLWLSGETMSSGIDCHKWESKVEMFRNLSGRRH